MDIHQSIDVILRSSEVVGQRFYRLFLDRHPEARPLFQDVNMARQAVLLTMQLTIMESYYRTSSPSGGAYLQVLGSRHRHRNVPRELYPPFRDAMLDTLAEFHGSDWDETLANQWRTAIDLATAKMFEGYEENFHV